ncbi:spore protein [Bacillus swezeyi]|uniref:Small, acid-soluble spore protein gamma-type n=1 Tax=Bacillus swezeyi TaxID=1925020 RepID=A0A1R1QLW3_9BACI|nr:gamma-type small acid-soluble spore protein [Bacillus swezeyi]OMI28056.1 spore protein [Bacillus swezeyi]
MANQQQQQSKTNAQKVRQQNQASAQGGQFGTEFASETDAQQVRKNNQQAEQNKQQNS